MTELVLEFKREIGVVDTLTIYDVNLETSVYTDAKEKDDLVRIRKMQELNCLDELDHLLIKMDNKNCLFVRRENLIGIIGLNEKPIGNYVILIHKTKLFLGEFANAKM